MQHFILTRFNLNLWHKDKNDNEINRNEWLAYRLNLFETYCLPSVVAQTEQNFKWIILVDKETPKEFQS